eukprot:CCRYP_020474-RA/>CCRYP_020474-RA protein AED:0.02 eAED:0.02 QI:1580/1/1/1/0.5/0.33/3/12/1458
MNRTFKIVISCDELADDALQNIHSREALIERLQKLHRESVVSRDSRIQRLLYGIHNASLAVIEAITAWNRCKQQEWYRRKTIELHTSNLNLAAADDHRSVDISLHRCQRCPFNVFLWNGENYMKKMLSDLDFVGEIPEALNYLGPTTLFHRNPFLIPLGVDHLVLFNRDEDHQNSSDAKKLLKMPWKDVNIQRVQQASFILLLDEFHREPDVASSRAIARINEGVTPSPCRDALQTTKLYPPKLHVEDFSSLTTLLDPPATCVIAVCCASLILHSMSVDRMVDIPEPIVLLSSWLRNLLAREYDSGSASSRSLNVDKVFSDLDADCHRRCAKAAIISKRQDVVIDDASKSESQSRNASVQTEENICEEMNNEQSIDNSQIIFDSPFASSKELVPFPVAITADLTEGSQIVTLNGKMEVAVNLEHGNILRFCNPYESSDWEIITPPYYDSDERIKLGLAAFYDHSRILTQERRTRDDAIYRLCYPYKKDIRRTSSPDTAFTDNPLDRHDVASDRRASNRSHVHVKEARIWKLIREDEDTRPSWRREFDDGLVPWIEDYAGSSKFIKHFSVRISYEMIEKSCRDSPYPQCVHQHRVNFFEHVSLTKVIEEAFHVVCRWHPKGNLVDNVKWAKLSRKMKFMSNMKNAKHEIDMAFVRHNQDRKLDPDRFHAILEDIATMQYPAMPIDIALQKVVWESLVMLPDVNTMMWAEAKAMAIQTEAKRVCAQIRIASSIRKQQQRSRYLMRKRAALIIEKNGRRLVARSFVANLAKARNDDERYKLQTQCSVRIQTYWRRYFWRWRFLEHQERRIQEERQKIATIRAKLREKRKRVAESIVYRDIIRIDSIIAAVTISFHDDSAFEEEVFMIIKVYVPATKETFSFRLEEKAIRECLENALSNPGRLSWNEMLDINALKELPKRLMLRVVRERPIFLFSRRNIVEKGTLLKKVAILAADDIFILSVFRSPHDMVFVTYQPRTCQQMRTKLSYSKLSDWLRESSPPSGCLSSQSDSIHKQEGMLDLLKPERQNELLNWLVKRVLIRKHPDDANVMQLLLLFEAEEERVIKLVIKVQSQWRRLRSQRHAKRLSLVQYEKIFNREYNTYAYRNVVTDERQWDKPRLLGNDDLSNPVDEWREEVTEEGYKYYVNYGTGQSSWLSQEDAARLVQRKFRSKHESDLIGSKIEFADIVKAMNFIHGARTKYEENPEKLANMVNYAMLRHCIDLDFDAAKPIYEKAIKQSPNHPLISRVYGIFLLASCQPSQSISFQTATRLFHEANVSDPHQTMIRSAAEIYFRWAVLGNAKNPLALLNYALLHQCIYREFDRAEKIYRATLALDPMNQFVTDNYKLFLHERYPGGAYASAGPPFSVIRRSEVVEERPEWAEWSKRVDRMCPKSGFEEFWYNKFTKATQFKEPDWTQVWETRVKRSSIVSRKTTNWIEYHDPRLQTNFFMNNSTKQFTCAPCK